ncbi:uncharacterized protein LOC120688470 [Panicum virgatum]|uniref:Uncharacterized protein n=1 Tax=Panicum virgatum TaxID=38727 RepID=A0A8T0MLZ3_PANVG|nr:uncharacterized protein LOC120688470 [Panicum virgatum]KAG2537102.1 hypothetical protein PVAP13_9NG249400 [Panicum virgatum]
MAGRCGFSPLARLLLLVVLLGATLHGAGAVARPLLGIAEPPASPGAAAAGPGDAAHAGAGGGPGRSSEAGGEVILAGFAAALIIVIVCYIGVTRESSRSSSGVGEKQGSLGGF